MIHNREQRRTRTRRTQTRRIALAAALLASPEIEAWPVPPDGDLTEDGDLVNPRS